MEKVNVVGDFKSRGRSFYRGEVRMLEAEDAERFRAAGGTVTVPAWDIEVADPV